MRHFSFGRNWAKFIKKISEENVRQSVIDLVRLIGTDDLTGKSVIDIGSGSGLHSAAFYKLNPLSVLSIDYDLDSVNTTLELLLRMGCQAENNVRQGDILELKSFLGEKYDIVYSWGVLHHTGNLDLALKNSASLVSDDGKLVIALYRKTLLCNFWRIEKRIYSNAPVLIQKIIFATYVSFFFTYFSIKTRKNYYSYIKNYSVSRGMTFSTDVHDWLGGYPYESIDPEELRFKMRVLGFQEIRSFTHAPGIGLFGSGCDEFVFTKLN